MRADETEKALRKLLRDQGHQLKSLTAQDVLRLATDFWTSSTIEDTRDTAGDGLVAYFELLDRNGTAFEFGINRIIRPSVVEDGPYHAWVSGWALRFSICFKPTLETFQIKAPTATFACWNKPDAAAFVSDVSTSPQFLHCLTQPQKSCSIKFAERASPWGDPNHPTQGYFWAVG